NLDHTFHRAGLVEDLDAVVATVADIEQSLAIELRAMRMAAADDCEEAAIGSGVPPLAKEFAGCVEDDDPMVGVAVGDIKIAISRIDGNVGGLVQKERAFVSSRLAAFVVRIVADALAADLEQELLAVVRPFLHDSISVPTNPDVIVLVDEAAVDP